MTEPPPVTRTELRSDLRRLGLMAGSVVMLHCRMSAIGWVTGGSETVVGALLDVLGPTGTVLALTGWEQDPYDLDEWPEPRRAAYLEDPPAFDPLLSESQRDFGRLSERIRTWPGAHRSTHPEASFAAVGRRAAWLTSDQPRDHPYGPGSPLEKLVEAEGRVLMLGAPLETITVLHYAEELARVPNKIGVIYRAPVRTSEGIDWWTIHDIDTSKGAFDYESVVPPGTDAFEVIGREAFDAGIGVRGKVGQADSYLFPGAELVRFAVTWMEERFARR
jgi:aminoglycoside 3-N-acetyltransferase